MKKRFLLAVILITFMAGCASAAPPTPPINLPFAVHQAGATVSTDVRIVKDGAHEYRFALRFDFKEKDSADRARVRDLVEPGIPIPLRLTISINNSTGERPFIDKEVFVGACYGFGADNFKRDIEKIQLYPGEYRVTLQSKKNIPELSKTKVIFGIYNPRTK